MPCDRAYVDEAGFIAILRYVVESVLLPQLLTRDGRLVMGSSAPESPEHPFVGYLCAAAGVSNSAALNRLNGDHGELIKRTIHDADPRFIPPERIAEFCREAGGASSTTWRREYECEIVLDESRAVVPEIAYAPPELWTMPPVIPQHRDRYVGWDTGHQDMSVGAFGYYDRSLGAVVIEAEAVVVSATVKDVVQKGLDTEAVTWGQVPPFDRVMDAPDMVRAEAAEQGYPCRSPRKDREASIFRLRDAVRDGTLRIGPNCPTIRAHLEGAVWNQSGREYDRVPRIGGTSGHHYDGLDAVRYLLDVVQPDHDPTPPPDPRLGGGWALLEQVSRGSGLSTLTQSPRKRAMVRARNGR
jgi:hypothetical protein